MSLETDTVSTVFRGGIDDAVPPMLPCLDGGRSHRELRSPPTPLS